MGSLLLGSLLLGLGGCQGWLPTGSQTGSQTGSPSPDPTGTTFPGTSLGNAGPSSTLLQESWDAYRRRFIQEDGRVIDWEGRGRSTSESQAYAMLRAVLINDPQTFELTLRWGEANLRRQRSIDKTDPTPTSPPASPSSNPSNPSNPANPSNPSEASVTTAALPTSTPSPTIALQPLDQLWAWTWGQRPDKSWGILDENFASDGDLDAVTALILAARQWNRPEYLTLARAKLKDLWELSTVQIGNRRYLLPGPQIAFKKRDRLELNPSYLAPYAFRLFAQVDAERDWLSLVPTSYEILTQSAHLSTAKLPSDWVALNLRTNRYEILTAPSPITSQYSFDAYRVWWRVSLDWAWFQAPEAKQFLQDHLGDLDQRWRSQQKIPAKIDQQGNPTVNYEATSQYGMLYAAWRHLDPGLAQMIYQQKIQPRYQGGLWDDESAYYSQNLVWLGIFPVESVPPHLLDPR